MLALEDTGQFVFMLSVMADGQTAHQVDRDVPAHQSRGGGQGQGLGELGDELGLVESEKAHVALPLGQLADKKRLAVNLDLQVLFGAGIAQDFLAKLDVRRLAEDGLEDQ